jgi:protease-4
VYLSTPKTVIIPIKGIISSVGSASPENIYRLVDKANEDFMTKGIIFVIDSPGGNVVSSREIAHIIKKSEKPTVCLLGDMATSGAYWVSSACDKIVADPLTLTASIGVSASYLDFVGFLEKFGINYNRLVTGEYKDLGSPFKNLSEEERTWIMSSINRIHKVFIREISVNRNVSYEQIEKIADGRVLLGEDAIKLGLVDELGGLDTAKEIIDNIIGYETELVYPDERWAV